MDEAAIVPENPVSHTHPFGTLLPVEFVGHDTAEHKTQTPVHNTPPTETARRETHMSALDTDTCTPMTQASPYLRKCW